MRAIEKSTRRKSLTKKMRFEVFKRDSFICQYCGIGAPEAILHVDHIEPVSAGGSNAIVNLITSCQACNSGKGARKLSESSALSKSKKQLDDLQARREQLKFMAQWQRELFSANEEGLQLAVDRWKAGFGEHKLADVEIHKIRILLNKHPLERVLASIDVAVEQYDSHWQAMKKLPGICHIKKLDNENNPLSRIYYIRGIVRNRFADCDDETCLTLLKLAISCGCNIQTLETFSRRAKSWSLWADALETETARRSNVNN